MKKPYRYPLRMLSQTIPHLQISVINAQYKRCTPDWGMENENPHYDRFYLIKGGEGFFEVQDNRLHPGPGQFLLLPAGVPHRYGTTEASPYERYFCHFTAKIGNMNFFQMFEFPSLLALDNPDVLEIPFRRLVHAHNHRGVTSGIRIRAALLELIAVFVEACLELRQEESPYVEPTRDTERIQTVLHYIEEHLDEKLSIDRLARQIHFHPNYFIHFFRTHLGVSPIRYITRMRIERAKHLLVNPNLNIKEIADAVGIPWSHFYKVFHRETGQSPTEYRRYSSD